MKLVKRRNIRGTHRYGLYVTCTCIAGSLLANLQLSFETCIELRGRNIILLQPKQNSFVRVLHVHRVFIISTGISISIQGSPMD